MLGLWRKVPVSGSRDQRIATIAGFQRGRAARRQLTAAGIGSNAIDRAVTAGRLRREHRGVFAVGHAAPVPLGPETAALLAMRDGAVLSHHTAAAIWGLRRPDDPVIHILVRGGHGGSLPGVRVHRATTLNARLDIRIRQGLPLTSPARTIGDIADELTDRQLEFAIDQGIVGGVVRAAEIRRMLAARTRLPGRARLAELVSDASGPTLTRSEAEEVLLALVRSARLAPPIVNGRLLGYEIDFYWPQARFAVEVDGYRFHSTRHAFENDHAKDTALMNAGITRMRVTWRQLQRESYAIIAGIARAVPDQMADSTIS